MKNLKCVKCNSHLNNQWRLFFGFNVNCIVCGSIIRTKDTFIKKFFWIIAIFILALYGVIGKIALFILLGWLSVAFVYLQHAVQLDHVKIAEKSLGDYMIALVSLLLIVLSRFFQSYGLLSDAFIFIAVLLLMFLFLKKNHGPS